MIVPPHILRGLERHGDHRVRHIAQRTRTTHRPHRYPAPAATGRTAAHHPHPERRLVYDCHRHKTLPGALIRQEGQPDSGDADVDRAYKAAGIVHAFFKTVFDRDSIDDRGMHLISSVHYDNGFDNAFWDGAQMIYGDGDGAVFGSFTTCLDVIAHEMMHGVIQADAGIEYVGESGALNESLADVFGTLVKQWSLHQSAHDADWLFGTDLFLPGVNARALRSLAAPGTAYDDPRLGGRDPQTAHMRDYAEDLSLEEVVHVNSGIPNHAFYLFATTLGGHAWERPGRIWYDAMRSSLHRACTFHGFAAATLTAARSHGDHATTAAKHAWTAVGVALAS